jgi:hypothetical protein
MFVLCESSRIAGRGLRPGWVRTGSRPREHGDPGVTPALRVTEARLVPH